jgi:predicted permease
MVLTPALLFRTMSTVHVERLDFKPVVAYFAAVIALFLVMFSQRYQVAEELVTASVAVSTALAMLSVSMAMTLAEHL